MNTVLQKTELRQRMRARRLALTPVEVRSRSEAIDALVMTLPAFTAARRILAYVSRGNEVMTHELIQRLLAAGREVGVPMFDAAREEYRASLVREFPADLQEGKLRILEPKPAAVRPVRMDYFEALLIPGLAFDERGHRLGRGKGYFDRMLEQTRGVKIALAYDFEVLAEVPAAVHDVPMDFIVTETQVVQCRTKKD